VSIKPLLYFITICFLSMFSATSFASQNSENWQLYKQHFIAQGRVVDNGNQQISHSEGQGYGMLLAEINNDRSTFEQLWRWTQKNLYREDIGLFAWRFNPEQHQSSDRNNATDGDILIGWALLRAGKRWNDQDYIAASEKIQSALLSKAVVTWADKTVMLPGTFGFQHKDFINLNPSYFIFPAWQDFYTHSHRAKWKKLIDDGLSLLDIMRFGPHKLPTDWVMLNKEGSVAPATDWPSRFSFDAIRIPLYLNWYKKNLPQNKIFKAYWQTMPSLNTPAWIDVTSNEVAEYPLPPGMMAVRNISVGNQYNEGGFLTAQEDYYSSSLKLLTYIAEQEGK